MSFQKITPQSLTRDGVLAVPAAVDETYGNYVPLTGDEVLMFFNSDSGDHVVTFYAKSSDPRGNKTNLAVTIPLGTTVYPIVIGPWNYADWNDASVGGLTFLADAGSTGTVTVIALRNPVNNPASQNE